MTIIRRAPVAIAALALLLCISALASAAPASAWEIRSQENGQCLDDSIAFGLREFPCNGLNFQQWATSGFGHYTSIRNVATGRCLDDSFAFGLRSFPCNGLSFQRWLVDPPYMSNQSTGRCVDHSFWYGLRSFPCNRMIYQRWTWRPEVTLG